MRLSAVTAVDWFPAEPRFEVVYHLHSHRAEPTAAAEVPGWGRDAGDRFGDSVWRAANWYEREVSTCSESASRNHPDLSRILMPDDWEGYRSARTYPVHGHKYSYQNE